MDLSNLKTKQDVKLDTDRVGGSRILSTDVYGLTIKLAYLTTAASGAYGFNLVAETPEKQEVKETMWVTSGTAKGGTNTYKDKDGNDQYLPGFVTANSIALLTLGKELADLDLEDKVVNLYDFQQKKELPTSVKMFTDLIGTQIKAAVEEQTVDKQVKNDQGQYVNTGETRKQNEIVKIFRERDSMTVTEIEAQATEAAFVHVWTEKNQGQIRDKSSGASKAGGAKPAAAAAGGGTGVKSLFQ